MRAIRFLQNLIGLQDEQGLGKKDHARIAHLTKG